MNAATRHPQNSFNAVRLFAAWLVLWSHSYVLSGEPGDPLQKTLGLSGGHVAVDVFFFISGLLIAGSIDRGTPWRTFLRNRALRIYPGLWVMLSLTCLSYALVAFAGNDAVSWNSVLHYLLRNGSLASSNLQYSLGSLFADNPYPNVVNGSLWTLPWELRMYALLGLAGYLLWSIRRSAYTLLTAAGWFFWQFGQSFDSLGLLSFADPWRFMYFFFLGALAHRAVQMPDAAGIRSRKWWPVYSLALIIAVTVAAPHLTLIAYSAALPALVIGVGYGWVHSGLVASAIRASDLSYGMYLYAFPIQQLIVTLRPHLSPLELTLFATVPTLAIAWMSWRYVERPALSLKGVRPTPTNALASREAQ